MKKASTVFQAQIVSTGEVIYCKNDEEKAHYKLKVLKMYAKLNEERAHIVNKIEGSGTIYGE
ncbi:hypothetical protein ACM26V_07635 [Salipaludibacillus sp. HK11]|uniref:hypothetical protein n=1 Tax=Salipaludibacillus sp. HK11 TaxID=3394320 RepID=UPI0039FBC4A7